MTTEVRDLVVSTYTDDRWIPYMETSRSSRQQKPANVRPRDNEVIIRECVERVIEALRAQAGEATTNVADEG